MSKSLKILLIGDYSNLHSTLAAHLRTLGHRVTVMSEGSYFQNTNRDIDTSRSKSKLGGAILAAKCNWLWHKEMSNNDIVALISPNFVQLRPNRLRYFFDRLKGENQRVFLTAAGTDATYVRYCLSADSALRYNEWSINNHPGPLAIADPQQLNEWLAKPLCDYTDYVYDNIDGVVSALYEYNCAVQNILPADKLAYGGIPIDTRRLLPGDNGNASGEFPTIFLGRHKGRYDEKGTHLLEQAARIAVSRLPKSKLQIIENVPFAEYVKLQSQADLVLDQVYSYTPATNALMAMSRELPVMSGAEPEFYDFIGEQTLRPIINAPLDIEAMADAMVNVLTDKDLLGAIKQQSRQFVVKHNDVAVVARRFLDFWTSRL